MREEIESFEKMAEARDDGKVSQGERERESVKHKLDHRKVRGFENAK